MSIRVLIIEADNRFRKNLYRCLQDQGFRVFKSTLRDDIARILGQEKIDFVLLGVDGLGREGLALIRPIKRLRPDSKIILVNDPGQMDLSIEGMDLGAFDDFLIPLDIDALAKRIREAAAAHDTSE